jgi:hypothetical protein
MLAIKTIFLMAVLLMVLLFGCACPVYVPTNTAASMPPPAKLMIFGGDGHKTYLGCLNCSEYATDSVFNQYGQHGSRYSSESVFNPYSDFGSAYSSYGACNPYATDPPVIVDSSGNYYGRLTLNRYHTEIGIGQQYMGWLAAVCQH